MAPAPTPDDLLTQKEAAPLVGVAPRTLERWRWSTNDGPPYIQVSPRCVRYRRGDLLAWVAERRRTSTADAAIAARQ